MNRNAMIAVVLIVIIGVAGVGVWLFIQPVTNPFNVAIVFATGGLGDKSFNDGCYEGASDAADDFGITFTYVETEDVADYEGFIRQYAQHTGYIEPYELIVCIGYDQLAPLTEVATEYPDQQFAIIDESLDNESTTAVEFPNVLGLKFKEHEGSALVGAMAGLMTTTDKIGFVGGMDIPLINKFAGGYAWGANYTNPDCNVTLTYPWDFGDPTKGKTSADTLYGLGCDIVFAAAGATGLGVFDSVKELNGTEAYPLWAIGVDSPQMYLGTEDPSDPVGPSLIMTSMIKKVNVAVYEAIKDACYDEDFAGGLKEFDIANGGIDYEVNSTLLQIDQDILSVVDELKESISNGTIDLDPFDHKWWLD
ncbi:MAG: BMP family protein [Candidatus Thorarchaeota archaeon]